MEELRTRIHQVEAHLDAGTYQPGPWGALLRDLASGSAQQRAALADDVTRVSNRLHQRHNYPAMPFAPALWLELGATAAALLLLRIGLQRGWAPLVWMAALILLYTTQPLFKITVGSLLGIRYAYAFLVGAEPRFKMRYGTYMAAARWRRFVFHLSGMVGSALPLWLISRASAARFSGTATVLRRLSQFLLLVQFVPLVAGLLALRRPSWLAQVVRESSGGRAASEIRAGLID